MLGYALAVTTFMGVRILALAADCSCNVRVSLELKAITEISAEDTDQRTAPPQGVMFVEIRRCVYGHELEGYKHANEQGDLEMVGGSHEERQGILGSYGALGNAKPVYVPDDS